MWRTLWRWLRRILFGLIGLSLLLVGGCFGMRTYRHAEIARTTAIDTTRGVDESLFVRVGGVDQWIAIRGRDRNNPVILVLHGGPGIATSPYPRQTFHGWTSDFTVVQWDQRGAGKTYGRSGPVGSGVTLEHMAQDGIEVAEFLRRRLHKRKIIIVGHSWGSMLGVRMAKLRPDLFHAYVGTGQGVNQGASKKIAYAQLLAEAQARGDLKALDELRANGPPPYATTAQAGVHTKWANAYEPAAPPRSALIPTVLFDSDANLVDLRDYVLGISSSDDHFRAAVAADDLRKLGPDFAVPVFIFQGAKDNVTPNAPVLDYFASIRAPAKELVLIPDAGHNAFVTRSDQFHALLTRRVRPLALGD